jgi:hypothetical protein
LGVITVREGELVDGGVTCVFFPVAGFVGRGVPVAGRVSGRLRRPFLRILSRVRRAAASTSLAVASAQRRWAGGIVKRRRHGCAEDGDGGELELARIANST